MSKESDRCYRTIKDCVPGIFAEQKCGEPAVFVELSTGMTYCESCGEFICRVRNVILKRIDSKGHI